MSRREAGSVPDLRPRAPGGGARASGFIRGLTIGALVGAAIAGTAVVRRFLERLEPHGGSGAA